jgi:hypothetical protein
LRPYCGCTPRGGLGRIHPTAMFLDPCVGCGRPRCKECAALFIASRI